MSPAIIVDDTPATLPEAVAEITRRRDTHAEWVRLNTVLSGDVMIPSGGMSANAVRTSIDMARAYDNALRLLRACGAAP